MDKQTRLPVCRLFPIELSPQRSPPSLSQQCFNISQLGFTFLYKPFSASFAHWPFTFRKMQQVLPLRHILLPVALDSLSQVASHLRRSFFVGLFSASSFFICIGCTAYPAYPFWSTRYIRTLALQHTHKNQYLLLGRHCYFLAFWDWEEPPICCPSVTLLPLVNQQHTLN